MQWQINKHSKQLQQIDSCSGVGNKIASFEESSHRFSQSCFFSAVLSVSVGHSKTTFNVAPIIAVGVSVCLA